MPSAARYAREKARAAEQGTTPYQQRIAKRMRAGETRQEAEGHGKRFRQYEARVKAHPERYSMAVLRRFALRAAEEKLTNKIPLNWKKHGKTPTFNKERTAARIRTAKRDHLELMIRITAEEWADLAQHQVSGNPFFYSSFSQDPEAA